MIWLLPALVSLIVLVFTGGMDVELVESWQFLFARIGLLVCVFSFTEFCCSPWNTFKN